MTRIDRIKHIINSELTVLDLDIIDDSYLHAGHRGHDGGEHTHLTIKCSALEFKSLSKVQAQRLVNNFLKEEFNTGLHAVSYQLS